jgi:hypothetical protein
VKRGDFRVRRIVLSFLLICVFVALPVSAWALDEPARSVEVFRKPGFDFRVLKTFGEGIDIQFAPVKSWSVEKSDPFLKDRIRDMVRQSLKRQGYFFVPEGTVSDATVKVKIFEWGRFRNTDNQNLIEYIDMDVRVFDEAEGTMVLRGTARYRLLNSTDRSMNGLHAMAVSMFDEIFGALTTR